MFHNFFTNNIFIINLNVQLIYEKCSIEKDLYVSCYGKRMKFSKLTG